ncbi:proprotein convertase subtilisin/kexin type 4, furin [Culex quinquefasciatus]|uniref:Proprotein convertase subtilisin/kexin type 4, furin n=1 Tax=Culex quinquefasciatus TaxID=7176 RepID=B0X7A0_CULQU|nr:proprotein convertase subtilisin/kexin type 4, furin [Culex quinquefasciatus]|eukprot:XP_001865522.1 proprotein convertase subtilisin/kexin type 4, furin [Culex quinquefasciatus]
MCEVYYDNRTCVPCEANCASCQDRPDYCTSCDHHLVMHEHKCYSACPKNTYETEDYNCADCHSSCMTCNGSSESQCILCRAGRFAHEGRCLNACPDGFFGDKKRHECMACPIGCATCSSGSICTGCHSNWTLNKKARCIANGSNNCDEYHQAPARRIFHVPATEYYENGHCHTCHSTCETCTGPTEHECLKCASPLLLQNQRCVNECDEGYYMEVGACAKCLHTCTQCVSRMNCTACQKGLQLQSGECRTTCADGYYSDRGTCAKCYLSCNTCSGPRRDQCVKCPEGWQLAGGECHPECPEGFFKTKFGCQKCHHYCKTCNAAGPLACTSCPSHFMLDGGLCMECLGSQFYDPPTQTCKTCHESCRSCSGPGQYSCVTCAFPLHLDRLNNQCLASLRQVLLGASPTAITVMAISGCLLVVTVFVVIFSVLQKRTRTVFTGVKYNKLATGGTSRTTRISMANGEDDSLQPIVNNSDEEEDDEEEEDPDDGPDRNQEDDHEILDGGSSSSRRQQRSGHGRGKQPSTRFART